MAKLAASIMFILCFLAFVKLSTGEGLVNALYRCECAGFASEDIDYTDKPLIIQNPINITCDEVGEQICRTICLDLAKLSKGKGPGIFCSYLKYATNLQPSMFTRVCDHPWQYADLTMPEPICCVGGLVVQCEDED